MSRLAALAALLLGLFLIAFQSSAAATELDFDHLRLEVLDRAGKIDNRAGIHPDRILATIGALPEGTGSGEEARTLFLDLVTGLGGSPSAVPACRRSVFAEVTFFGDECSPGSQIGAVRFIIREGEGEAFESTMPLFNVEVGPDEAVAFGGHFRLAPVLFTGALRPDQGLTLRMTGLLQIADVSTDEVEIEFWGVPSDHQKGSGAPRLPFFTTPTRCGGKEVSVVSRVETWERPGEWTLHEAGTGQPLTDCAGLTFAPRLGFALDEATADSSSGATITITVPQREDADERASAQLRSASIVLPEGLTLSPGGASGLRACTDAELGAGTDSPVSCPPASRVGSVELSGPSLVRPLHGSVYIGASQPGQRFRLFLAASGAGAAVKLVQSLRADPATGRLTATLEDLPEVSFEEMTIHLDGGAGALLATPAACGAATASARFTPYSGSAVVESSDAATIAARGGCGAKADFAPGFDAGATATRAAAPTSFVTSLKRRDGEQMPDRFQVTLPAGLSASLGAVARCPDERAAAGSCPAASRIGAAEVELGPGAEAARLHGDVFLTGAYRGAPFGVALAFPARIGPFDLGTMVVRGTLAIDPLSGRVTIATDRLPRVFEGVAIRFQAIRLEVDRPGLLRNPTSCVPGASEAGITSQTGVVARASAPFRAEGCVGLRFRPRFELGLDGKLGKGDHPSLRIAARLAPGGANLRRADFTLPKALRFDASGLEDVCARGAATAGRCPAGSRVGEASARTPVLAEPLRGPVHVVAPQGGGTPELWASLRGSGVRVEVRTATGESGKRIVARLRDVPDLPLRSLGMRIGGGGDGVLVLDRGLCRNGKPRRLTVPATIEGQNRVLRKASLPLANKKGC